MCEITRTYISQIFGNEPINKRQKKIIILKISILNLYKF